MPINRGLRSIGDTSDMLGESPMWSTSDSAFYWVDIRGKLIRRWSPRLGKVETWPTPSFVGCIAPRRSGGLIVGLQDSIAFFDPDPGVLTRVFEVPGLTQQQRLNDGKCDPQGRFWVGSMNIITREPDGVLYCVSPNGTINIVRTDIAVPNSLSWSVTGDRLYFSQTRDRKILAFPFDASSGSLGEAEQWYEVSAPGTPDGATVDAQDHLWFAEFGNRRLTRLTPDGHLSRTVDLPCRYPTSCAFGGESLNMLLVTSAYFPLNSADKARMSQEGRAYVYESDICGREPDQFAG